MNYADFKTQPQGFPLESDATLGFMQDDYQSAIKALAKLAGTDLVIITGLTESGSSVSDGWILYNGDLVYFQAGTKSTYFIIEETTVQKANENGTLVDRYTTKIARFGTGSAQVAYANLKRATDLINLELRAASMLSFETAVIISGCEVSSVNTGASTLAIAAGLILIDGKFVSTAGYAGTYPVYLPPSGVYTTSQPGSGTYITFDPYTSQRKAEVMRRAVTPVGQILEITAVSDRFEASGLGKWEWKGFALCNGSNGTQDRRGRFTVGYDNRNSDPGNGIWDVKYNTAGQIGGEKSHTLTIAEMPRHNHTQNTDNGGNIDPGEYGLIRKSIVGENKTSAATDTSQAGVEPDIITAPQDVPFQGGGAPHENRPPFFVTVYVQRI